MKNLLLLIVWTFIVQSCEVSKNATKNKTQETTVTDFTKKQTAKTFDFSVTDNNLDEFTFKPFNASDYMHIVTAKGDTVTAKNTSITRRKSNTKTVNNITRQDEKTEEDNSVLKKNEVVKTSEKKETLSDRFLLYIFGGFFLMLSFLGGIALFLMYKSINKNAAALNGLLSKIG